jgi:metal dependent phosphohydrolase
MALEFIKSILDDVHGLIPITEIEKEIIDTKIFKRLHDIKQLSLTHFIFPGSEHTRYSHSLGVMHLIDKMATSIGFNDENRQIVRLAGLLHDIGHYPLSHVGEAGYSKKILSQSDVKDFFDDIVNKRYKSIDDEVFGEKKNKRVKDFLSIGSNRYHHEMVSAKLAIETQEILDIMQKYLSNPNFVIKKNLDAISKEINDMIRGNYQDDSDNDMCLKIQLLHSEIDADRLDYLLRDSKSSGTSYGTIDIDYLISNLRIGEYEGKSVLGISTKAINAADQFLLNRFFSYTNVIFNDKVSFLGELAELAITYFAIKGGASLMDRDTLKTEIVENKNLKNKSIIKSYYEFNDYAFWNTMFSPNKDEFPDFVKFIKRVLSEKKIIKCVDETELRMITSDSKIFYKEYKERIKLFKKENYPIFISSKLTKHIPIQQFEKLIKKNSDEVKKSRLIRRMLDGITIIEDDYSCHLLIDDMRSLVKNCFDIRLYCLREYEIEDK